MSRAVRRRHDVPKKRCRCLHRDAARPGPHHREAAGAEPTAGLAIGTPILFSSVAHGSAFDIAGKESGLAGGDDRGDPAAGRRAGESGGGLDICHCEERNTRQSNLPVAGRLLRFARNDRSTAAFPPGRRLAVAPLAWPRPPADGRAHRDHSQLRRRPSPDRPPS